MLPSASTELFHQHPEHGDIFRLWQIFAERTNPMTKILHAPSIQQRISNMDPESCSPSFRALLFAIYLLAVVSLSSNECSRYFGEERNALMARYASGAWQSLMAAGVFETQKLEVLQALVLFIVCAPS